VKNVEISYPFYRGKYVTPSWGNPTYSSHILKWLISQAKKKPDIAKEITGR